MLASPVGSVEEVVVLLVLPSDDRLRVLDQGLDEKLEQLGHQRSRLAAGGLDALGPQQGRNRLRRLGAVLKPVLGALLVDVDRRGLGLRVVLADRLDRAPVTRRAFVGDDDAPDRVLLRTHASKSDADCHRVGQISVYGPLGAARAGSDPKAGPSAAASASSRWPSISSAPASGRTV